MELCSAARLELRLSKAEFLGATPRELDALFDRLTAIKYREDLHFGIIASMIANFAGAKTNPDDFVLIPKRKSGQTPEQRIVMLRYLHAALGGELVEN